MKAVTLTQPWASLVSIGAKSIETRSWGTSYRGLLAIHAAKSFPAQARNCCGIEPFMAALRKAGFRSRENLPLGAVLAVVRLVDCRRITADTQPYEPELSFGDYTPGRYAWIFQGVERFPAPVPAKGALGLWEWATPEWSLGQRVWIPELSVTGTIQEITGPAWSNPPYSVLYDDMRDGVWGDWFWGHELEAR